MNKLEEFLIEAKKKTYANAKIKKVKSNRLSSKDYEYQKNNMLYHDTYFGQTKFIGEEIVYIDNSAYWAMNYYGITIDDTLEEKAMDAALRPALMMVGEDKSIIPVRGPRKYYNGEYKYTFEATGNLDNFIGVETIYKNDIKIYELKCHGGKIK